MKCDNHKSIECKEEAKKGYFYCSSCISKLKAHGYEDEHLQIKEVPPEDVCAEDEFWPLLRNGKIVGNYKSKDYAQSIVDGIKEDYPEETAIFSVGPKKIKSPEAQSFINFVQENKQT